MIPKWEDSVAVEDSEAMPRWEDSEPIEAMPTAPPVSDRQERASLITQRGPEARMAQAAQQEAITAAGKDSDEVVMQLQSLVDKGDTGFIDPAVLAQYRHKITFPEQKKGAAKVDPAVSKRIEDRQQTPVEPLPESMFAPSNIAAGIKNAGRDALGYAPEQALALTTQAIDFFPGLMRGAKETARSLWTFAIGEENTQAIEQLSYKIPVLGDILKKGDELLDASGKLRRESSELLMKEAIEQGGMTGAAVASLVESIESTLMTLKTMKGLGVGYGGQAGVKSTLKAAGVRATLMAATTEGLSPSERLKAAGLGFAYQATPALSGTIGKWTKSDAIAKVTDIASNFGITAPQWAGMMDTGYAKAEAAGKPDMGFFYGLLEAIKAAGSDVVFGIMTQAFHEQGKTGAVRAMEDVARKAGVKPRFAEPPAKVAADTVDFKPLGEVETEPVKPLTVEPKKVPDAIPKPVSAEVAPPVAELPAKPTVAPARMPQEPSEPTWEGSRPVTPAEQKAKGLLAWFAAGDRIGMKMERFLKTKGLAWDTLPKRGTPEGNALNAEWRAWDKANIDQPAEPEASKPAEPVAQRGTKLKSGAALDIYFNEQINYGGETRSRGSVIVEMQKDGIPQKQIDAYMMGAKTLAQPAESAGKRASGEKPLTDFEVRYTTKDGNRGKTWVQAEDAQLAVSKAQKQFNEEGTGDKVTSAVKSKMPMTEPVVTKPIPIPGMKEAAAEAEKVAKGPGLAGGPGAAAVAGEGEFAPRGKVRGRDPEGGITSIRNRQTDMEREQLGLPKADPIIRRTFPKVHDQVVRELDNDPTVGKRLIDDLRQKPRALTDREDCILLREQVQAQAEYNRAAQETNKAKESGNTKAQSEAEARLGVALDNLFDVYQVGRKAGTETARGLNARKMFVDENFDIVSLQLQKRAANGGEPLTRNQMTEVERIKSEYDKTKKALDDLQARYDATKKANKSTIVVEKSLRDAQKAHTGVVKKWQDGLKRSRRDPKRWEQAVDEYISDKKMTIPADELNRVKAELRDAAKIADEQGRDAAVARALNRLVSYIPLKTGDWFDAYIYTNMLSNPMSHARNILGNLTNQMALRPLGLLMRGDIRGAGTYLKHSLKTVLDGSAWQQAIAAIGSGKPAKMVEVMSDLPQNAPAIERLKRQMAIAKRTKGPENIIGKAAWKSLNWVSDFMQASDVYVGRMIEAGETARLIQRGESADYAKQRGRTLASEYLYHDRLGQPDKSLDQVTRTMGHIGIALDHLRRIPGVPGRIFKMVVPFLKTPVKIAQFNAQTSFLGFIGANRNRIARARYDAKSFADIEAQLRNERAKSKPDMERVEELANQIEDINYTSGERYGKAMVGTALTALGSIWAANGNIAWNAPEDKRARELFYDSGRRPYSFRIGNKWIPMMWLGPGMISFAIPAAIRDIAIDDPESIDDAVIEKTVKLMLAVPNMLINQLPLEGMASLMNILKGREDYTFKRFAGTTATQVIPLSGMMRFIKNLIDPTYRKAITIEDVIKAGIPGLSEHIQARKDSEGLDAKADVWSALMPYKIGKLNLEKEEALQDRLEYLRERKRAEVAASKEME
jgi:hypothetical protein